MAVPPPPPPPPPPPLPQGTQHTTGSVPPAPPPPVEPTAGQDQKEVAVVTPKGQGEDRGALWDEIRKGKQLKKVASTTTYPAPSPPSPSGSDHDKATVREQGEGKTNFLTEMVLKAKLREEKLSESGGNKALEELEEKQKTPPTRSSSPVENLLKEALAERFKAFHDDEDDEPEHADLVKLITENKIDVATRKKLEKQAGVENVGELVKFIQEEFNEFDDYYDEKKEEIQKNVIQQLEKIKENLDRGEKLPSTPVAKVDTTKGQFPPKIQSAAKAIGENLPMTPKDGYKTLPPTPSPKLVGIKKEPSSREV